MRLQHRHLVIEIVICYMMMFPLFMALVFGSIPKDLSKGATTGTQICSPLYICENMADSADRMEMISRDILEKETKFISIHSSENEMDDIVKRILENGVFLFGADLPADQAVSSDGKYIDWNTLLLWDNSYWEMVAELDLSALAPISDTENATMLHTTYIINKNMEKFYHSGGGIADSKGEHERSNFFIKERSC